MAKIIRFSGGFKTSRDLPIIRAKAAVVSLYKNQVNFTLIPLSPIPFRSVDQVWPVLTLYAPVRVPVVIKSQGLTSTFRPRRSSPIKIYFNACNDPRPNIFDALPFSTKTSLRNNVISKLDNSFNHLSILNFDTL